MKIWWTLIRKEWLALRWKLAALTFIPIAFYVTCLLVDRFDRSLDEGALFGALISNVVIAPILLAMYAAVGDRVDGTIDFVRGLPVSRRQLGLARILAPLAVLAVPIIVMALVSHAVAFGFSLSDPAIPAKSHFFAVNTGAWIALVCGVSLYLWTTALAMNQPTDLRAGAIGVAVAVLWGAWTIYSVGQWDNSPHIWRWMYTITALGPFAAAVVSDPGVSLSGGVAVTILQVVTWCVLTIVAANRYGVLEGGTTRDRNPFRRRFDALAWMQWQQARPIFVAVPASVFVLGLAIAVADSRASSQMPPGFWFAVGHLWAIVIAVTLFSADLDSRLYGFWRSRPIGEGAWFGMKYATGAVALVALIDLPAFCLMLLSTVPDSTVFAYLICVPLSHLAAYSIAVLIVCVVRNAIYSGILSMGAMTWFVILPELPGRHHLFDSINPITMLHALANGIVTNQAEPILPWLLTYLAIMALVITAATLAAWQSIEHDFAVRT